MHLAQEATGGHKARQYLHSTTLTFLICVLCDMEGNESTILGSFRIHNILCSKLQDLPGTFWAWLVTDEPCLFLNPRLGGLHLVSANLLRFLYKHV